MRAGAAALRIPWAIALALAPLTSPGSAGEKNEPQWVSFDEGLRQARSLNKKVLVDVYTNWCGWCKQMDSKTYGNTHVAKLLAEKFVVVKLNAESDNKLTYKGEQQTEQELAGAFGISGYPSTIFLTSDGEPITIYPGFADAIKFQKVLTYIADDHYLTKGFDEYQGEQ